MTRYLLDTSIVSNAVKPVPPQALLAWLGEQNDDDLFISSLTVAEIRRGVLQKPPGRKRDELEAWFSGPEGPLALFAGRGLSSDQNAALIWARLMARGAAAGRPRSGIDMIVAATAAADHCTIMIDNEKDFAGLEILNPLRACKEQLTGFSPRAGNTDRNPHEVA